MKTKVPKEATVLFQEYDLNSLDVKNDKGLIIGRILELGDLRSLQWLFKIYTIKEIAEFVKLRGYRTLSSRTFNFWLLVLDIEKYQKPEWLKDKKLLWRF